MRAERAVFGVSFPASGPFFRGENSSSRSTSNNWKFLGERLVLC